MKKRHIAIVLLTVLVMSGCGWFDRKITANLTGYAEDCVDGVLYLQFPSGVTVKYNKDGTVAKCDANE